MHHSCVSRLHRSRPQRERRSPCYGLGRGVAKIHARARQRHNGAGQGVVHAGGKSDGFADGFGEPRQGSFGASDENPRNLRPSPDGSGEPGEGVGGRGRERDQQGEEQAGREARAADREEEDVDVPGEDVAAGQGGQAGGGNVQNPPGGARVPLRAAPENQGGGRRRRDDVLVQLAGRAHPH